MGGYGNGRGYSRPESKFLWVEYWVDGKPYRESTGTTAEREANQFLARRIAEKAAHQTGLSVFIGPQNTPVDHLLDLLLDDYRIHGHIGVSRHHVVSSQTDQGVVGWLFGR